MEYVKSAGASNVEGPTDTLFREGLDDYWNQYYSSAIPKFEEVKRLFPQHSEVDRLVQSSQQAKAEGKEKSSFPLWIVGVIVGRLFIIGLLLIIIIIAAIVIAKKTQESRVRLLRTGKASSAPRRAVGSAFAFAKLAKPASCASHRRPLSPAIKG